MSSNQNNQSDNNQSDSNQSDNNPSDSNRQQTTDQQVKVNETLPMAFPASGNATYASVPVSQTNGQNSEQTIQYIPPVYTISGSNEPNQDIIVTEPMVIAYQYGKAVKCLTLFDIFFGFLHLLVSPLGIITIIFPFLGYKGASTYNKCFVDTYLGYQLLFCIINILILLNVVFNNNFEVPEGQSAEGIAFFQTFSILVNIYFIRITKKLSYSIVSITQDQKAFLMHLNFQNTGGMYY